MRDGEDPVELRLAEELGGQLGLAGLHPVAVALDRVDLAVVRDEAVRVGQRPAREGVGGEPGVDQGDRGGEAAVGEVREERLQLPGGEHALVDEGAGGERGEVHPGLTLGTLAQDERLAVQDDAGALAVGNEDLAEGGHGGAGAVAEKFGGDRDVAPAEDLQALLGRDLLDRADGLGGVVGGEEGDAHGIRAGLGKFEGGLGAQEGVRDLTEDAGAVAGVGLGAGGAAVFEVAQYGQRLLDQLMAGHTGQSGHEPDATGVVLVTGVVHPLLGGATVHGRPGVDTHRLSRRRRGICGAEGRRWPSAKFRAGYMMGRFSRSGRLVPTYGHRGDRK
ncbi:hypothetical protein GA0115253_108983 [Streptomyces sp. Termitarium-T10T-6]|nr:hypothetical protein GA0115253_108983 [Streptomyces sp. Termitarium-T10T-6]